MADNANSRVVELAMDMIAMDTRYSRSNLALIEYLEERLQGFETERVAFRDAAGTEKAGLVAFRGQTTGPCVGLCGHLDTVPPVGWTRDPFLPEVKEGKLYGLGSSDLKGSLAAAIVAAETTPLEQSVMLLITCDEESTKEGARRIVGESELLVRHMPAGIVVVEPTSLHCIRGHRVDIQFVAEAVGIQAHSSTAEGRNANIDLIPFLADMRALHIKLRTDPRLQDSAYRPTWCDLNIIVDNYGAAPNITVGRATCRMKFRYSKSVDPEWVVDTVEDSAKRQGLNLTVRREGTPPELPADHPLIEVASAVTGTSPSVVGFGSDASQFSAIAPCVILGPSSIEQAHKPDEFIDVSELERAVPILRNLVVEYAKRVG